MSAKQYAANGLAGCVSQRRSRETGTTISIYNGAQAGLDTDNGEYPDAPWSTVCEEHSTIVSHDTLALARSHAANPLGWCEECAEHTHTIAWWGVIPTDGERVPRNRHMNGRDWGWDATCSCGWDSRTGGAIQERVREAIADHKREVAS